MAVWRRLGLAVVLIFLLGSAASIAQAADQLILKNGDRLTGSIQRKDREAVIIKTDYAGEVRVQWDKVSSLNTDHEVRVLRMGSSEVVSARVESEGERQARLVAEREKAEHEHEQEQEPEQAPVKLDEIVYINPYPNESGEGIVYNGHANLAFSATRGNSDTSRAYVDTQFNAVAKEYRYSLGLRGEQREDQGNEVAANWLGKGDIDWFINEKRFRYARTSLERDRFKDISLRSTIGAGLGYQLVDTSDSSLSVQGGLDYVRVNHIATEDQSYPALGWGIKYSQWLFERRAQLFHEQEGFWNLSDLHGVTLRSTSGLRVPLTGTLNATAQLNLDYEGLPAEGRKPLDSTLLFLMGYNW